MVLLDLHDSNGFLTASTSQSSPYLYEVMIFLCGGRAHISQNGGSGKCVLMSILVTYPSCQTRHSCTAQKQCASSPDQSIRADEIDSMQRIHTYRVATVLGDPLYACTMGKGQRDIFQWLQLNTRMSSPTLVACKNTLLVIVFHDKQKLENRRLRRPSLI